MLAAVLHGQTSGGIFCSSKPGQLSLAGQGTTTTEVSFSDKITVPTHIWLGSENRGDLTTFAAGVPNSELPPGIAAAIVSAAAKTTAQVIGHVGVADDCCISGGRIVGSTRRDIAWPGEWHSHTGMIISGGKRWVVERLHTYNTGDALRISQTAADSQRKNYGQDFIVRDCAFENHKDDMMENDMLNSGITVNCFSSGFNVFSARPGTGKTVLDSPKGQVDGTGNVWQILNCIAWLKPQVMKGQGTGSRSQPWHHGGAVVQPWYARFMKWGTQHSGINCHAVFRDNVFRFDGDGVPILDGSVWGSLNDAQIDDSQRNVLCAVKGVPPGWPTRGWTVLTGDTAKKKWNETVRAWQTAHPDITLYEPGLWPGFQTKR